MAAFRFRSGTVLKPVTSNLHCFCLSQICKCCAGVLDDVAVIPGTLIDLVSRDAVHRVRAVRNVLSRCVYIIGKLQVENGCAAALLCWCHLAQAAPCCWDCPEFLQSLFTNCAARATVCCRVF